jgi:hypothetical protein
VKYTVVKILRAGQPVYTDGRNTEVTRFCTEKRELKDSACASHYKAMASPAGFNSKEPLFPCPYGLASSGAVQIGAEHRVLTGFWTDSMKPTPLPARVREAARVDPTEVAELVQVLRSIESDVRMQELEHFEAALHDARHLNQTITDTAERLLAGRGYSSEASPWDMRAFREEGELKRFLMIYSASRDLSAAMLMHEISRDPSQATRDVTGIPMHRMFYRQFRISDDRLRAARMTWRLGETDKTLRLSSTFRVVPKILIDNAVKYGARDSEITVRFEERVTDNIYRIVFTNSGPIIREDEREKVFLRGVRGSNKGGAQGQGLGLWLAKIIVEANTGTMELRLHERGRDMSGRRIGDTIVEIKLLK